MSLEKERNQKVSRILKPLGDVSNFESFHFCYLRKRKFKLQKSSNINHLCLNIRPSTLITQVTVLFLFEILQFPHTLPELGQNHPLPSLVPFKGPLSLSI